MSRRAHEEMVAELRREIADRKEEARKIMDLFTLRATGEKIFYPDVEPEKQREPEDLSNLSPVEKSRRELGPKANIRSVLAKTEKASNEEFLKAHNFHRPEPLPEEMTAAIKDGRAAASKGTN